MASPYGIISATMNPAADCSQPTSLQSSPIENALGAECRSLLNTLREVPVARDLPAYLVGGPVRDWLLGRPVWGDLDISVEGDAPFLARALAEKVGGRLIVHNRFGTATVECGEDRVDLVTARSEKYPVPGSLPIVEPSTIRDDLARRDFTINAIALPLGGGAESIVDPFDGLSDLRRGLVRTIHAGSFVDDPTRLFRAVRYEQRLGFRLAEETAAQLTAAVRERLCDTLSGDRLRHEMERMAEEERPERSLSRAAELGLLSAIVPGLAGAGFAGRWAAAQETRSGDALTGCALWLGALAYPLSPSDGERFISRLNLRVSWAKLVREVIRLRTLEPELEKPGMLSSELFLLLEGIGEDAVAVATALTDSPVVAKNLRTYLDDSRQVATSLRGGDLLNLGVPPGPTVGNALTRLRNARLDRQVNSEAEERQWVRDLVAAEYGDSANGPTLSKKEVTGGKKAG